MTKDQIILAWKDETYRSSLTPRQTADLPLNPAGHVELSDNELGHAVGGATLELFSFGCCKGGLVTWFFSCNGQCDMPEPTFNYACK